MFIYAFLFSKFARRNRTPGDSLIFLKKENLPDDLR